jgi:hypothetical protein
MFVVSSHTRTEIKCIRNKWFAETHRSQRIAGTGSTSSRSLRPANNASDASVPNYRGAEENILILLFSPKVTLQDSWLGAHRSFCSVSPHDLGEVGPFCFFSTKVKIYSRHSYLCRYVCIHICTYVYMYRLCNVCNIGW